MLNIQSVIFYADFFVFYLPKDSNYKAYVLVLIAILSLLNYLVLYRNKYYEKVFADFDKHEAKYERWNKSVKAYIILSIAVLLSVLILADLRNHGRI